MSFGRNSWIRMSPQPKHPLTILEGTERLDFERAQDTYRVSQVGNSDAASADNKYCPYCLKHNSSG